MSNDIVIFIGIAGAAFATGWLVSMLSRLKDRTNASEKTPDEHHQIRSLEASLRVAQKHADDMKGQLEATTVDFNALREAHEKLEDSFDLRGQELQEASDAIRQESRKVKQLRRELTTRAEDKIRAEARAKHVETELSVMQAGSEVMKHEVNRLDAERQGLTDQLHAITGTFEESLLAGEAPDDQEPAELKKADDFVPDC
jgi:chromosome segregation ATPase